MKQRIEILMVMILGIGFKSYSMTPDSEMLKNLYDQSKDPSEREFLVQWSNKFDTLDAEIEQADLMIKKFNILLAQLTDLSDYSLLKNTQEECDVVKILLAQCLSNVRTKAVLFQNYFKNRLVLNSQQCLERYSQEISNDVVYWQEQLEDAVNKAYYLQGLCRLEINDLMIEYNTSSKPRFFSLQHCADQHKDQIKRHHEKLEKMKMEKVIHKFEKNN